jgi:segregation and condensation protein B
LFERLFGLESLAELPALEHFEPSEEEQGELRDKLLRAGEQRVA